jgi:hypothetical protein
MITKRELLYHSLYNQYLIKKTDKATVVSHLCGLQAQFANNPKHALRIRANDFSQAGWGDGLVKIWSFRGTLHAVRIDEIGLFLSAKGVPTAWDDSWWGLDKEIKPYWSQFLYEKIAQGICGREELKKECRAKGMQLDVLEKVFHGWGGLLKDMCSRGMIAYDIGTAKRFVACGNLAFTPTRQARAAIIKRYFEAFAPATFVDCATFTGYTKTEVRGLIEEFGIPLKSVLCEGIEYYYLNDLSGDCKVPSCLYLAGFDQMIMGYKDRSRLMNEQDKRNIITNSGIIHPTILLNGKLRAKWKKDGEKLVITPFAELSSKNKDLMQAHGMRLFKDEVKNVVFVDEKIQ